VSSPFLLFSLRWRSLLPFLSGGATHFFRLKFAVLICFRVSIPPGGPWFSQTLFFFFLPLVWFPGFPWSFPPLENYNLFGFRQQLPVLMWKRSFSPPPFPNLTSPSFCFPFKFLPRFPGPIFPCGPSQVFQCF